MVTLITRADCHLCGPAKAAVADACAQAGVPWAEVDVDDDPEMRAEYGDRVPVVLIGGVEYGHHRIDVADLTAALTG